MGRAEACICCQEIEQVKNKLNEAVTSGECEEEPTCITQHPGFHPVCINRWVLQTAWYQYKQQYKESLDGPEDKLYRHIAYRHRNWPDGAGESWARKLGLCFLHVLLCVLGTSILHLGPKRSLSLQGLNMQMSDMT